jgi:uncharacterized protein YwgA
LNWNEVRPKIEAALKGLPEIDVRLFAPSDVHGVRELTPEADKPKMTPGRAAILKVLSIYRQMRYPLSQLEVQKLAYFLVGAGQPLGRLSFKKNKYGPYASELRHVLTKMDGAYLHGVGDGTKTSEITVAASALREADAFFEAQQDRETAQRVERIVRLIEGFETPYGMELLSSVHWVAAKNTKSYDEIVSSVHGWNERKRSLMKPAHIKAAYDRLVAESWIAAR